jgi:hypothetical protein
VLVNGEERPACPLGRLITATMVAVVSSAASDTPASS